jgi:hypothetical protein
LYFAIGPPNVLRTTPKEICVEFIPTFSKIDDDIGLLQLLNRSANARNTFSKIISYFILRNVCATSAFAKFVFNLISTVSGIRRCWVGLCKFHSVRYVVHNIMIYIYTVVFNHSEAILRKFIKYLVSFFIFSTRIYDYSKAWINRIPQLFFNRRRVAHANYGIDVLAWPSGHGNHISQRCAVSFLCQVRKTSSLLEIGQDLLIETKA